MLNLTGFEVWRCPTHFSSENLKDRPLPGHADFDWTEVRTCPNHFYDELDGRDSSLDLLTGLDSWLSLRPGLVIMKF